MKISIRTLAIAVLTLFSITAYAQETKVKVVVIPLGGDDIPDLNLTGPQFNIPQKTAEAAGFSVCHSETYGTNGTLISDVLTKYDKPELMLACRPAGDTVFQLLAHAPRADVTFDTGTGSTPHNANGTAWYYSPNYSWGYAREGSILQRASCDTAASEPDYRMCIHTEVSTLDSGYRCGANIAFNATYERVFLHR